MFGWTTSRNQIFSKFLPNQNMVFEVNMIIYRIFERIFKSFKIKVGVTRKSLFLYYVA